MTHTPGPWRIGDAGTTIFGPKTDKPIPVTIASLLKNDAFKANARLIAAAPELLEALKNALASLEHDGHASAVASLNTHGRAAIAKAEGK